MTKLILVSILLASVIIPLRAARDPRPKRAFRKMLVSFFAFEVLYLVLVLFVYPRL